MEKGSQKLANSKLIRIAIVGPESTGKTTLSGKLAQHYETVFVPEYAREYLDVLDRPYSSEDIEIIAKKQIQIEDKLIQKANKLIFSDTELIVIKIWMEFKYNKCPKWVKTELIRRKYDLYLLCNIDIPWSKDSQREHPNSRKEIFDIYYKELKSENFNHILVSGDFDRRLSIAINAIDQII